MSEQTNIEWCDSINPNATGRTMGAYKSAAKKCGCTVEDWIAKRVDGNRWCHYCRSWKRAQNFALDRRRPGGLMAICRPCASKTSTASRYGMRPIEIEQMREAQDGKCALCHLKRKLVVDHDHATGKVRKLLCSRCNSAIGLFLDDINLMQSAIKYLEAHRG